MKTIIMCILRIVVILILVTSSFTNYCKICENHPMCKFDNIPKETCRPYYSPKTLERILLTHNSVRSEVALGRVTLPSASNMMRLFWDQELEDIAVRWGIQCQMKTAECTDVARFSVAQQYTYNEVWNLDELLNDIIQKLVFLIREENKYRVKIIDSYQDGNWSKGTQAVWAKTTKLGCAIIVAQQPKPYRLFCNYGEAGNIVSQPIYLQGEPRSMCPSGAWRDKQYAGLCALAPARHISSMMLVLLCILNKFVC